MNFYYKLLIGHVFIDKFIDTFVDKTADIIYNILKEGDKNVETNI